MPRPTTIALMLSTSLVLLFAATATAAADPDKAEAKAAANVFAKQLDLFQPEALRLAIQDLTATFPGQYRSGPQHLKQLARHEGQLEDIRQRLKKGDADAGREAQQILAFQREVLLANPLLDFDRLLLVRRGLPQPEEAQDTLATKDPPSVKDLAGLRLRPKPPLAPRKSVLSRSERRHRPSRRKRRVPIAHGLPQNWQGNCALPKTGYDNEIAVLAPVQPAGRLTTLFRPEAGVFVGDVDLHFDADRMLFSMSAAQGRWQVYEIRADGTGLRQVTPGDAAGRAQLRRLLPARRADHLRLDGQPAGRALRRRQRQRRQPGAARPGHRQGPDADLRAGSRLVPDGAEQRPPAVHAVGVHRCPALLHAPAVPHESRRHGPDGVLRQQFLLAQRRVLRAADPRASDEDRGDCQRASRRAADGRIGDPGSGPGPQRGGRGGAAASPAMGSRSSR